MCCTRCAAILFAIVLTLASETDAQRPSAPPMRVAQLSIDSSGLADRRGMQVLLGIVRRNIVSAAEAMPADKYTFVPSDGEFKGVRSFGRQLKHLAATNYILAAAALGHEPPPDAGDEMGPDSVVTKSSILVYVSGSFDALERATDAIGEHGTVPQASAISPLRGRTLSRTSLIAESLAHAGDHYGQIVEYLRMNGVIPPASRP
jgi:DinB family protein